MKLTDKPISVNIDGSGIRVRRTTGGVAELWGQDDVELARGMGFAHAHDRMVQMMLVRLAGQGRLSECLKSDDETLAIDIFMRQMGFARCARDEASRLTEKARAVAEAYCSGVNGYLRRYRLPLELRLVRYRPEPWTVPDILLTINLMSYVGLAQSQQDMEKFLIQAIQGGVPVGRLKQLFAPHLDGLDDTIAELIRKVRICQALVPQLARFAPGPIASNNWALSGKKSESGFPIQCNDPHLEVNRLPPVWYEFVLHTPDDYRVGVNMPGGPGMVMGRTRNISLGFTYGFMDMIDYFIEECRDGKVRRGADFKPLETRKEVIKRKKRSPVELTVFETGHGVLETDPEWTTVPDGLHLCCAYSAHRGGAARTLNALVELPSARTVQEAQKLVREISVSCNWVIADREGNIGYQQSGLLPARKHSGLYPLPGWEAEYAWDGIVSPEELSSLYNPKEGIIATANDDRNQEGKPLSINLCMGSYRVERILELLNEKDRHTVADMERIQTDLLSTQARRFMAVLRPLIPDTPSGRILAEWGLCYDAQSRGATLFEAFYNRLLREVFGKGLFGVEAWDAIVSSTCLLTEYFHYFDDILLGEDESWFGSQGREGLLRQVLTEVTRVDPKAVEPWGKQRQLILHNIFFAGKLPRFLSRLLRVDYGPIALPGNRSTIVQGGIFRHHGRLSTFAPSYRYITDLGTDEAHTVIAGGPSGRVFSRWYTTDIHRWMNSEYKTLRCRHRPP